MRRRTTTRALLVLVPLLAVLISSCSDGVDDVRSIPSAGWSSFGGNAQNSNFVYPEVSDELTLSWSRPVGGPISAPLTISGRSSVGVTAGTDSGCNTFLFDPRAGRKNFCKHLAGGVQLNAMLVDQYENIYLGEAGTFFGLTGSGDVRWRFGTVGVPLSAKFAAPGLVLMVSHLGQILLFDSQTGKLAAPGIGLRPDADPSQPLYGLGDCVSGGPRCPVQAPPAVDSDRERFYLNYWPEGAIASQVRGYEYAEQDGERGIRESWQTEIPGGVIGPPTLSADRRTVYVFNRLGSIYALDALTGTPKWDYFVDNYGFATMTITPDGLLIPTGVLDSPVRAFKDEGDKAVPVWQRTDLRSVSLSALTNYGTAWTVVRKPGEDELTLMELNAADGTTKRELAIPGSVGFTTGVAVSASGQVATATNLGEVYFYDVPKQQ
ncbi:PQQ-binding-like beta-propeller repeat protein [Gordonia rubripertincta]|uniref:PQQ-binding-like beta-propeller repeat protein n=1 Tax=Gordonia rubripertincta TaxID=36822 RepID=A0ABT4MP34_GORRU|nr:PQQ-binding-like beta-propeller repeat protein [Gordonia rubripertincta]MCZ4548759.1 PQQ-binding-like beta-propeller repeat protein [Gordonia rubripertincta]